IHMPKLAKTPLNENCSAIVLKKLPEKQRDPGRFLIHCDFTGLDNCLALADLGASINLMPLSIWKKLRLPTLNDTKMVLELADRTISKPTGDFFSTLHKDHKVVKPKNRSEEDEPPKVELKELPPHLEYAFLGNNGKWPVIIAKDLSFNEKTDLINVLKTQKKAIAWKLTDIKGIDPEFCSHRILLEEEHSPKVQSKRRVNPKIHDVIKKEVEKLLDAGLIYPISDSPWEKSHFMVKEGIVLGHKISKKRIEVGKAKIEVISKLPHPTTEFDFKVIDTRGVENYAADHLSRLENPYENVFDPKEINETFPLESLNKVAHKDQSTPWYADLANYHAGNFITKAYHPQTSGQVEVTNRGLKRILERTVGENRALWSDKLEDALWAFRTAYKTSIGCTPYHLVYGKACHLPLELEHKAYWALKHTNFDFRTAGDHRKLQLNELNELHDDKIKNCIFNVGDQVLLFNSRLKIFSDSSIIIEAIHHRWRSRMLLLSLRTTEYRDRVEPTTRKACHLSLKLEHKAYWVLKHANFNLKTTGDHRKLQLNELNELRDQAYENSLIYKERTKKLHDDKIKICIFNVGDQVLLFNSRLKIFSDSSTIMEETYHRWRFRMLLLSLRTTEYRDRVEPTTRLVAETFDWDEKEVSDDEEVTQVKVPMALVDDELTVGKNH
nr:reverse transcriptase domain-containing protein [Tanacetum cinerariifolium]